jgi:hypothetical protein
MKKKQHKADVESKGRDSMVTSMGTLRGRYHVRALCQTVAFVCLVGGYCLVNLYNMNNASMMESSEIGIDLGQGQDHRRLEEEIEDRPGLVVCFLRNRRALHVLGTGSCV